MLAPSAAGRALRKLCLAALPHSPQPALNQELSEGSGQQQWGLLCRDDVAIVEARGMARCPESPQGGEIALLFQEACPEYKKARRRNKVARTVKAAEHLGRDAACRSCRPTARGSQGGIRDAKCSKPSTHTTACLGSRKRGECGGTAQ